MHLEYATKKLERICTDARHMQRKLGAQVARSLKLRIAELRNGQDMTDLLVGLGRWEELSGDRQGQWSARLTGNWRLIVEPHGSGSATVHVVDITDYH